MIKLFIALHGYGSNGNDMNFLGEAIKKRIENINYLSPNAPFRNAYQSSGFEWFPIEEVEENHFLGGIRVAYPIFEDYLKNTIKAFNVKPEEVVLGGFSQGACLAIHTGLHFKDKIGGIISFSGGFINPKNIMKNELVNKPKILLIHGEDDEILPSSYSKKAYIEMENLEIPVKLKVFPKLGHKINSECINSAINFLEEINSELS